MVLSSFAPIGRGPAPRPGPRGFSTLRAERRLEWKVPRRPEGLPPPGGRSWQGRARTQKSDNTAAFADCSVLNGVGRPWPLTPDFLLPLSLLGCLVRCPCQGCHLPGLAAFGGRTVATAQLLQRRGGGRGPQAPGELQLGGGPGAGTQPPAGPVESVLRVTPGCVAPLDVRKPKTACRQTAPSANIFISN